MTPAQVNKELMKISNIGTCCIFTVVTGSYVWYTPMFLFMLRKAYPEYTARILTDSDDTEILTQTGVEKCMPFGRMVDAGYRAACKRFLFSDEILRSFDYVLITDIDIMIIREANSIVDQHMLSLRKNNLECYDNYTANGDRCPGVHFVTRDWWNRTKTARAEEANAIERQEIVEYDYDERMLKRIIGYSGLPIPSARANLWAHHGEHLGAWRRGNPQVWNTAAVQQMLNDKEFMDIADYCSGKAPELKIAETFNKMRTK